MGAAVHRQSKVDEVDEPTLWAGGARQRCAGCGPGGWGGGTATSLCSVQRRHGRRRMPTSDTVRKPLDAINSHLLAMLVAHGHALRW